MDDVIRQGIVEAEDHEGPPRTFSRPTRMKLMLMSWLAEEGADAGRSCPGVSMFSHEQQMAFAGRDVDPEVVDLDDVGAVVRPTVAETLVRPALVVSVDADQVLVDAVVAPLRSVICMPRCSAIRPALTSVTFSSLTGAQQAPDHRRLAAA